MNVKKGDLHLVICRACRITTHRHLTESRRDCPTVNLTGTDVSFDGFANTVVAVTTILELSRARVCAGHREANLQENRLDAGDSTPATIGEKL
jgi:hypothetical protein